MGSGQPMSNRSKQIDREIKQQRRIMESKTKILVFGSGNSGLSTFIKQMILSDQPNEFRSKLQKRLSFLHENYTPM